MSTFIKGDTAVVYVYDTPTTSWKPVACLTSNSLSSNLGTIETQTKCDPGETITQAGSFSYSLDLEGNYIDTTSAGGETTKDSHDALLILQQAKSTINWKMDTGLADTTAYYGTAIISDLSADFPAGDEFATFSATFQGSGAISTTDPFA